MSEIQDIDLGTHKGRRRVLFFEQADIGIVNVDVLAGATAQGTLLYAPGFVHFSGRIVTTTPISTTLNIQVRPRPGGDGQGVLLAQINFSFTVATIITITSGTERRYGFYWGAARGVLTAAEGSTWCFSTAFQMRVQNVGVQPANNTSVEGIECS